MQADRVRIQSMLASLTPFQQEQVRIRVDAYRNSLVIQRCSPAQLATATHDFWKTMVTYLYEHSGGRSSLQTSHAQPSQTNRVPQQGPPPPPKAPHPLAMSSSQPGYIKAAGSLGPKASPKTQYVDKSGGLISTLMHGSAMPVGLQDWANRVYYIVETQRPNLKPTADKFVTETLQNLSGSGQLWKLNWISYPVPTLTQLVSFGTKSVVIDLDDVRSSKLSSTDFTQDFVAFGSDAQAGKKKRKTAPLSVTPPSTPPVATPGIKVNKEELRKRNERAKKFKDHLIDAPVISNNISPNTTMTSTVQYEFGNDEEDVFEKTGQYSVVGSCKNLEKRYLRLTSAPDPALVRPEPVLARWLDHLTKLWNQREKDWKYIEDQMRAIRQDLTVQNLRGAFTTRVYETNARWALESGDLGQFNQCQTQLKQLHQDTSTDLDVKCEFLSYRLVYYYLQSLRVDEQIFLSQILSSEPSIRNHRFIVFALGVRKYAATNNFVKYFEQMKVAQTGENQGSQNSVPAPHMKYLLEAFESRQRVFCLMVLCKSFVTQIPISWLASILRIDTASDCEEFVVSHGGVLKSDGFLEPKESFTKFSNSPLLISSKLNLMG
jgi:hypothetical protein